MWDGDNLYGNNGPRDCIQTSPIRVADGMDKDENIRTTAEQTIGGGTTEELAEEKATNQKGRQKNILLHKRRERKPTWR